MCKYSLRLKQESKPSLVIMHLASSHESCPNTHLHVANHTTKQNPNPT